MISPDRFEIGERLGEGGMGVVFKAFDRKRGSVVALKTLTKLDADLLYRLKNEFRSLSEFSHPNLVRLHELFADGDSWFFTMDFVDGTSFVEHVRVDAAMGFDETLATGPDMATGDTVATPAGVATAPNESGFRERPLRDALRQLALGVRALHADGKLHRDIKPSNVLVGRDGRVHLLDFGLVSEIGSGELSERGIFGTPAFMAPEQARGEPATPASDWYAVGVMLYEALTGALPFVGRADDVLRAKQVKDPEPPSARSAAVPPDLDQLCVELLQRDPRARASGDRILNIVESARNPVVPAGSDTAFVGRRYETERLESALRATATGRPVVAMVDGPSGAGKTTLVNRFLGEQERAGACILRSRCHEREFVPFKAFDGIMDDLTRYWSREPASNFASLLPADTECLSRLFPTLRRLHAVEHAVRNEPRETDNVAIRRKAFVALKELFTLLSKERRLIVFVDDVQWSDDDSASIMAELVGPPEPPAVLFVFCHREDTARGPLLDMFEGPAATRDPVTLERIAVEPLSAEESEELAARLLDGVALDAEARRQIAVESNGLPYFVSELARFVKLHDGHASTPAVPSTLRDVLRARIEVLDRSDQRLLSHVAVAGRPIEIDAVASSARVPERHDVLERLISTHLLRRVRSGEDIVTVYHDRVREAVTGGLGPEENQDICRRLAEALEVGKKPEAEWLSDLYARAGSSERAGTFATVAGDEAAAAMAFARAAEHYQFALSVIPDGNDARRSLLPKVGTALGNAGRSSEAAAAYLEARGLASGDDAGEFERLAAEQFLRAGRTEDGIKLFRDVLARAKISYPDSMGAALAAFLVARMRVRLRGIRYTLRDERDVNPELMRKIHALRAAYPIIGVDPIRGSTIMAQYYVAALDAGVPDHVMHVIVGEGMFQSFGGGEQAARKLAALRPEVAKLTAVLGTPEAEHRAQYFEAMGSFLLGRWKQSAAAVDELERIQAAGNAWEKADLVAKGCTSRLYMGELGTLRARVPVLEREARERKDAHQLETLLGVKATLCLADDEPERALETLAELEPLWTKDAFSLNQIFPAATVAQVHLYRGDAVTAHKFLLEQWRRFLGSGMERVQIARVMFSFIVASAFFAVAARRSEPAPREARKLVKALENEELPWCRAYAKAARAAVHFLDKNRDAARKTWSEAAIAFDAVDMLPHAASCRLSALALGGEDQARRDAEACLVHEGVKNVERWITIYTGLDVR